MKPAGPRLPSEPMEYGVHAPGLPTDCDYATEDVKPELAHALVDA